ncbi:nicotinamidase [Hesseltinella vesiculosa]|uniref:nicotinamidase n=1 Tax=Hesseltinella vesiculosa TaxID=101127 RepID=A0A1X2G6M6_9FUNG|nr:nicotinamidase [Hesseltinella vesiculosa]
MSLKKAALIIVDMQYDFLETGPLPVFEATQAIPRVQELGAFFNEEGGLVIATQDWHPPNHASFASQHEGKAPLDTVTLTYRNQSCEQVLWPDHCIQGSRGADILDQLVDLPSINVKKGTNIFVDSYSAFADNQYHHFTDLAKHLYQHDIEQVVVCGYATDYCLKFTAVDAIKFGFETIVIKDTTKAAFPDAYEPSLKALEQVGVQLVPTVEDYMSNVKDQ